MSVGHFLTYVAMLRGIRKSARALAVEVAVTRCDLHSKSSTPVSELSGGWQRRVAVAQALLIPDDVVLLDEPTVSLDVGASRELWSLFGDLGATRAIVVASHEASAVLEFADYLVPVSEGIVGPAVEGALLREMHAKSGLSAEAFLLEALSTEQSL